MTKWEKIEKAVRDALRDIICDGYDSRRDDPIIRNKLTEIGDKYKAFLCHEGPERPGVKLAEEGNINRLYQLHMIEGWNTRAGKVVSRPCRMQIFMAT